MSRKRKNNRKKKPVNERYEVEVDDWEVDYHFGVNQGSKNIVNGDYQ